MSKAVDDFTAFWRKFDITAPGPRVHPADMDSLDHARAQAAGLQLQLLPLPVNGSLERASAVIVMLNSGFGASDAAWEANHPSEATEREASRARNILQSHTATDRYPFYDFNPRLADHPGAQYWRKKLGSVCREIAIQRRLALDAAREFVANRVAVVQRVAYASSDSTGVAKACGQLPSSMAAQSLVRGLIEEGKTLIIVVRGASALGLSRGDEAENLVVFDPQTTEPVRADLSASSRCGKALVQHLCAFN
jgi:hypothetical protein